MALVLSEELDGLIASLENAKLEHALAWRSKIDLSPEGVTRRLHEASSLYALCQSLRALPGRAGGHP